MLFSSYCKQTAWVMFQHVFISVYSSEWRMVDMDRVVSVQQPLWPRLPETHTQLYQPSSTQRRRHLRRARHPEAAVQSSLPRYGIKLQYTHLVVGGKGYRCTEKNEIHKIWYNSVFAYFAVCASTLTCVCVCLSPTYLSLSRSRIHSPTHALVCLHLLIRSFHSLCPRLSCLLCDSGWPVDRVE